MNAKQRLFCEEYFKCREIKKAAIKAGYSENYATHRQDAIINHPEVKAYIAEIFKDAKKEAILSFEQACEILTNIAKDETIREQSRIKSIETLSKLSGWNIEDRDHVENDKTIRIEIVK